MNLNPSSREIYVIGIFDCGCKYDAGFSSLEIVKCTNNLELEDIKQKMNKHSIEYQCDFNQAMYILVVEGKLKFEPKKGFGIKGYNRYVKAWKFRDKEGRKTNKDISKFNAVFDRRVKWMQRESVNRDKITAQEDANTGCGLS
jgi:hypothetical protein